MGWAVALGAAALATSTAGIVMQGEAQSSNARYQAQVARNNEIISNRNAQQEIATGQQQAMTQSLKGAAKVARLKVAQAASGIDVNSGSAVDVRAGEAEGDTLDTLTVMHNATLRAYGYKTQATNEEAQAGLYDTAASQAGTAAAFGAAGNLLGGASSLSFKWNGMQNPGSGASSLNNVSSSGTMWADEEGP